MMEPLYQTKVKCACCEHSFSTSKVRPSFKKPVSRATDFYLEYKGINPDYYLVRVCPNCGYSSTENFVERLNPQQKNKVQNEISANWATREFGGNRNWEQALATFKLALICAQTIGEKDRIIAGLLHHIAWLFREKQERDQEDKFLRFALDAYIAVFENEGMDLNNAKLMYLIGELYRRLGIYNEAVRWFSRVIHDKRIVDAAMIKAARDQWSATREEMLAAKLELSEEMRNVKNA